MNRNKLYIFILIACFIGYIWLFFSWQHQLEIHKNEITVCVFKKITQIPCPSCGTTRAVLHISKGEIIQSILLNPFGILVSLIMVVCPIWIFYDFLLKKETFYHFYQKTESFLRIKIVALIFFILVLLNWIWNIQKNV